MSYQREGQLFLEEQNYSTIYITNIEMQIDSFNKLAIWLLKNNNDIYVDLICVPSQMKHIVHHEIKPFTQ